MPSEDPAAAPNDDPTPQSKSAYARAGVDLEAGGEAVRLMRDAVRSTFTPAVLSDVGNFGGLYDAAALTAMDAPVLVASTDGVGTKTLVAAEVNTWRGIGADLVNHCINDVLVQGARPLFFLDYVASAKLSPPTTAEVVGGMADACRAAGCALLGGETAEMPGVYHEGAIDVVGTLVGVVDRAALITGAHIEAGDAVIGLTSNGLHTNGFTLARSALAPLDWTAPRPDLDGQTISAALLAVHRSYLPAIEALHAAEVDVRGLAHITGGGLVENPPRILPEGLGMRLRWGAWPVPPIFGLIQQQGGVSDDEMRRVFNMGLGMLAIVPAGQATVALNALTADVQTLDGEAMLVGEVTAGPGMIFV